MEKTSGQLSRPARPLFCDITNPIYDRLQGRAFIAYLLFVLLVSLEKYFCPHVFNRFDEDEPTFLLLVPIHCSNAPATDTVNWNSHRCALPVHRPTAANVQGGEPNQIYTVGGMFRNHDL